MTSGMRSLPTASITSKPFICGICTSRNTRSGDVVHDRGDGLLAVAALRDDLDVRLVGQQAAQPLPRERLIVHDQGPDFFHVRVPMR